MVRYFTFCIKAQVKFVKDWDVFIPLITSVVHENSTLSVVLFIKRIICIRFDFKSFSNTHMCKQNYLKNLVNLKYIYMSLKV